MREQSMIALRQKQVFESMQRSRRRPCDEGAEETPHHTAKNRKIVLLRQSRSYKKIFKPADYDLTYDYRIDNSSDCNCNHITVVLPCKKVRFTYNKQRDRNIRVIRI
jgi:hypothetical protein